MKRCGGAVGAVLPTFNTNKKNVSGKELYIKISKEMIKYYNEKVLKNKPALDALVYYKMDGYKAINNFLTKNLQPTLIVCAEKKRER